MCSTLETENRVFLLLCLSHGPTPKWGCVISTPLPRGREEVSEGQYEGRYKQMSSAASLEKLKGQQREELKQSSWKSPFSLKLV